MSSFEGVVVQPSYNGDVDRPHGGLLYMVELVVFFLLIVFYGHLNEGGLCLEWRWTIKK